MERAPNRDVWPLVDARTMRALDAHTIEGLGIPADLLMECAGRLVAGEVLRLRRGWRPEAPVLVACGPGNNGGDGLVVARHLHLQGVPVRVWPVGEASRWQGEARENARRAEAVGVAFTSRPRHEPGTFLVDAIFGTGLARPLEGAAAKAVAWLNGARPSSFVLAVDLPSGIDADTGQQLGVGVEADATVALGLPKIGLALEPGRSHAGEVTVARIGIADAGPGVSAPAALWTRAAAARQLPARPSAGHKGGFGHVLVVAGSEGKTGAAALAAAGASRAGAGLVTVACPQRTNPVIEGLCVEAMTAPVPETAAGSFARAAEKLLLELAEERDVVVAGPGIGRVEETAELARRLAGAIDRPLVLDADGLWALGDAPSSLLGRRAATVLTPHPGEAAALLGTSAAEVNRDRPAAARELAAQSGAVAVLKGAGTVIAEPDGRLLLNPTGGPLLASGGTGDVLAGLIGGLLAQGCAAFEAAALGAFVHGAAADLLAARRGQAGTRAGELADAIPEALHALRSATSPPIGEGDAVAFPEPR